MCHLILPCSKRAVTVIVPADRAVNFQHPSVRADRHAAATMPALSSRQRDGINSPPLSASDRPLSAAHQPVNMYANLTAPDGC